MGGLDHAVSQMDAFRNALSFCDLSDLGCKGTRFTWNNRQEGDFFIQARLDRFVADAEWCEIFLDVNIVTEVVLNLDHLPLVLKTGTTGPYGGWQKQFRYEAHWAKEVVRKVWRKKFHYEDMWKNMKEKLESCSRGLLKWRRKEVGAT